MNIVISLDMPRRIVTYWLATLLIGDKGGILEMEMAILREHLVMVIL